MVKFFNVSSKVRSACWIRDVSRLFSIIYKKGEVSLSFEIYIRIVAKTNRCNDGEETLEENGYIIPCHLGIGGRKLYAIPKLFHNMIGQFNEFLIEFIGTFIGDGLIQNDGK
jgi:hypothetical protein